MNESKVDKAFIDSIVPKDCHPLGMVAVVAWIDEEGSVKWRPYSNIDASSAMVTGLLFEAAMFYSLQPGVLPYIPRGDDESSGS